MYLEHSVSKNQTYSGNQGGVGSMGDTNLGFVAIKSVKKRKKKEGRSFD